MLIRWNGFGVRVMEAYTWGPDNGYVMEVRDPVFVQELLTHPLPDKFSIDASEPLLQITNGHAAELSLCGIATAEQLAALDDAQIANLAQASHVDEAQVKAWMEAAAL